MEGTGYEIRIKYSHFDGKLNSSVALPLRKAATPSPTSWRYDFNQHLSASVNLNNVFDREYLSDAGDHGMYGAPRNIMTGLKYNF